MYRETKRGAISGLLMVVTGGLLAVVSVICLALAIRAESPIWLVPAAVGLIFSALSLSGLFTVSPNQGRVLQLFGAYRGTVYEPGLRWANPFFSKRRISVRVRNFESDRLKVNDSDGNPIEIATVVVWRVVDSAEAIFQVDDYQDFVKVQSESALRNLATRFPYDTHEDGVVALRSNTTEVADLIKAEVQDRLQKAGVEVLEARISHLAYSSEIASAMLQRQQADAIIAARQKIVEGAVGMVQMALQRLSAEGVVELDEERRAAMVSNLLVVLCGQHSAAPVINAGTLY